MKIENEKNNIKTKFISLYYLNKIIKNNYIHNKICKLFY